MACTSLPLEASSPGSVTFLRIPTYQDIAGTKILSGNVLLGYKCCSATFKMKAVGTVAGTVTVGLVPVTDTTGNFEIEQSYDVTTLGLTSSYQDITFTFDMGAVSVDDVIGIKFAATSGSIDIEVDNGTPYQMANQTCINLTSGTWTTLAYSTSGALGKGDAVPTSAGLLLPPPVAWI